MVNSYLIARMFGLPNRLTDFNYIYFGGSALEVVQRIPPFRWFRHKPSIYELKLNFNFLTTAVAQNIGTRYKAWVSSRSTAFI